MQITVKDLVKKYKYPVKSGNFFKDLFNPQSKEHFALKGISFEVGKGETVAFIGPNGAGKSTTIKILTGILNPTSGEVNVDGLVPQESRKQLAYKIGTVFGTRSQLLPNLPLTDTFEVFASIYGMEQRKYKSRIAELKHTFGLNDFIDKPVRKLSLGQRMRAEIALSILHNPGIIFLDEPTIGLDILAKRELRTTLKKLNNDSGTTIFLTSHDMSDIEALCDRTIVVNEGEIVVDSPTVELGSHFGKIKYIKVKFEEAPAELVIQGLEVISYEDRIYSCKANLEITTLNNIIRELTAKGNIMDLDVTEPDLEEIIGQLFMGFKQK